MFMPCPEVTAHPATARRKAGGPRRPDADQSWQVNRCSCRHPATAKRKAGGPRRPDADQSWQVTRRSCRARRSRPTLRLQSARQVVRGVPTRIKVGRSLVVRAAPGGHGPPCDCKAQGRWSAASPTRNRVVRSLLVHAAPGGHAHPGTATTLFAAFSEGNGPGDRVEQTAAYIVVGKGQQCSSLIRFRFERDIKKSPFGSFRAEQVDDFTVRIR